VIFILLEVHVLILVLVHGFFASGSSLLGGLGEVNGFATGASPAVDNIISRDRFKIAIRLFIFICAPGNC
jgi:hypothetical protein